MYLASIPTFFPASLLALYLAFYLTSFLAYVSGISSEILSGILSGIISSEFLRGWCPGGNALIRSLRWRSGGERSDPEVAVGVRRTTEEEGGGRRRKEEGGLANIKSNNPHLTGGENFPIVCDCHARSWRNHAEQTKTITVIGMYISSPSDFLENIWHCRLASRDEFLGFLGCEWSGDTKDDESLHTWTLFARRDND